MVPRVVFEKKIFTPTRGSDVVLSTILPSMRDCDIKGDKKQTTSSGLAINLEILITLKLCKGFIG